MLFADLFTLEHFSTLLSVVGTVGTVAWALVRRIATVVRRVREVNERVDTLWGFHMSRGRAEAVNAGLAVGTADADDVLLVITPKVRAVFEPIREQLAELGRNRRLSRDQLAELIEKQHKDWLVKNVCVPLGIHQGGCLVLAVEVARSASREVRRPDVIA